MAKPSYVKYETPVDIQKKALAIVEAARAGGNIRKGTNECTKAIERGEAKLVVIAEDVDPPEIVMHLPELCAEKRIPFIFVKEKTEVGKAAGLNVPSAAIAVANAGGAEADGAIKDIINKMEGKMGFKGDEKKEEKKKDVKKKPAKKEVKKAEKKEETMDEKPNEEAKAEPKTIEQPPAPEKPAEEKKA
ncbi:50S ribosomal protein L7Ae [Candidatus Micrarchaeota archaeon]|nr:50S ribosomal protein L7Ae [Candidatus Micrarchaeota archaeon]